MDLFNKKNVNLKKKKTPPNFLQLLHPFPPLPLLLSLYLSVSVYLSWVMSIKQKLITFFLIFFYFYFKYWTKYNI